MAHRNSIGFTVGDGLRLGIGFMVAQLIFAAIVGVLWFAGVAALLGVAAVSAPK